jgi:cell division protein FtsB
MSKFLGFLKEVPAKAYGVLLALFGLLFLYFKVRRESQLEVQAEKAEYEKKDAVLAERQANVHKEIQKAETVGEEAKARPKSLEEVAKGLNSV